MMLAAIMLAAARERRVVGITSIDVPPNASVQVTWPSGTRVGDIAIVTASYAATTAFPGGWLDIPGMPTGGAIEVYTPSQKVTYKYKVLTGGDITTPPSVEVSGCATVVVVRGYYSVSAKYLTGITSTNGDITNVPAGLTVVYGVQRDNLITHHLSVQASWTGKSAFTAQHVSGNGANPYPTRIWHGTVSTNLDTVRTGPWDATSYGQQMVVLTFA